MRPTIHLATALALLAALVPAPRPAQAETYHACAGFIDSLPATIATQGTWCLRGDLNTAMTSGAAITIAANNVTVDCNDFKLGGLAAGDGTLAKGILAVDRQNATVRHCNVRGFLYGAELNGGAGHAVLDSRFDNNTYIGISIRGDGSVVRGNRVNDTGGSTNPSFTNAFGIYFNVSLAGTVIDNFVQGVYATAGSNGWAYGAIVYLLGGDVARNAISVLQPDGTGQARGISNSFGPSHLVIRENVVGMTANNPVDGIGIRCQGAIARDNSVGGLTTGYEGCADAGGNFAN